MARQQVFSQEQTWLECISCGYRVNLLQERKFRCPKCGCLFDVQHDWTGLPPFKELQSLFNVRANPVGAGESRDPKRKSGVWRFKELIMPFLPDEFIVSLGEGNVPIVPAGLHLREWIGGDIDLHLILEGMTPTGSFKDLGGTVMMSVAKAIGVKAVGCASTGDTSAMAAAYAALAGIQCFVILPKGKITLVQLAQALAHGAKVIILPVDFDGCMEVVEALVAEYGAFPANSLNATRIEGHQATVFLIAQHFNWQLPKWIVLPVGNGSNCSSVGKALRLLYKLSSDKMGKTRILGCQSSAANPLAESWRAAFGNKYDGSYLPIFSKILWENKYKRKIVKETTASAARIGNPVSRNKVIREIIASGGAMQEAAEKDLNEAVAVCGKDGHFVCPQTGIALASVRNAVSKGWIKPGERVVVVSTATGLKFIEPAIKSFSKNIIEPENYKPKRIAKILGLV